MCQYIYVADKPMFLILFVAVLYKPAVIANGSFTNVFYL